MSWKTIDKTISYDKTEFFQRTLHNDFVTDIICS